MTIILQGRSIRSGVGFFLQRKLYKPQIMEVESLNEQEFNLYSNRRLEKWGKLKVPADQEAWPHIAQDLDSTDYRNQ